MTAVRAFRIASVAMALVLLLIAAPLVQAAPITFIGADPGANSTDPRPNSNAAQAAYSAAVGPTTTITFETAPLGSFTSLTLSGVTFTGSTTDIRNTPFGSPDALFGYNTTAGGSKWVDIVGGDLTATFSTPVSNFGAYITGAQSNASGQETITFNDGSSETVNIPNNLLVGGGAAFVGVNDPGKLISSVTFHFLNDIVGVDDFQFGTGAAAAVPEPSMLALLGLGIAGLAGWRRWRKTV
jgi:hypothetical protein